ncbi:DUF6054 family protein [Sporolactobacillus kofuensis]|uniref:DUF6054 family protein n=1 Tax=Sporolactobacillus kofuensis TaxID=269672 RepID=A0ABW1WBM2_9BACL|nr:DUF6054 family protein [Sporolactobacillus kofuensis]MCO7175288.1 DUF6054 family protein [Sporolactobacillus kofuensis]
MADRSFLVSVSIEDAVKLVKQAAGADQVHELQTESEEIKQCILAFQKYFFRNSSYAALTAVIDNISGKTKISVVITGGSGSIFGSWDWGATYDWLEEFMGCFSNSIIEE